MPASPQHGHRRKPHAAHLQEPAGIRPQNQGGWDAVECVQKAGASGKEEQGERAVRV